MSKQHVFKERTVLDVLTENLKNANRKTYLHRITYVFEYTKPNKEFKIEHIIDKIIGSINANSIEKITGVLLYYDRLAINMVEGSEEDLMKHLEKMVDVIVFKNVIGRMKILMLLKHIKQRFFNHWGYFTAQPQMLLGTINAFAKLEDVSNELKIIIMKMFNLWNYLRVETIGLLQPVSHEIITDRMVKSLPEYARLYFALETPMLRDLRTFVNMIRHCTEYKSYSEKVFPLPKPPLLSAKFILATKDQKTKKTDPTGHRKISVNTLESEDIWSYTLSTQTVVVDKITNTDLNTAEINKASASAIQNTNEADIK